MKTACILLLLMLALWGLPSIVSSNGYQTMDEPMPRGTLMVAQAAQAPSVRNFTVYVGVTGFNSTGMTGMRIDVNEGDMVTIRFVYNDTIFGSNNPHDICIQGYNLCTGTLDENIPERVLSFTANIVGQSTIECIVGGCAGHAKLQASVLDVIPYSGPQVKTNLTLTGEVVAHSRPIVVLVAQIYDENSSPVPGVLVHFFRESTWGFAEIGADASDNAGRANITYSPPLDGHITFMAHFLGSGIYMPSSSEAFIHYVVPQENDYDFPFVWGQNPIFDFTTVGVPALSGLLWIGVVVLIVGSVWTTYLYVVRQLLGIRNAGRGEEDSERIRRLSGTGLGGHGDRQAQPLRPFDYPRAVILGLGMIVLGYADFLALTVLIPSSSLLALPLLAFIEAVLFAKLFPSEE